MSATLAGLTPIEITKLYLFGTTEVPADFNDRIRDPGEPGATEPVSMIGFLTAGPGRYANPARSEAIERDYHNPANIPVEVDACIRERFPIRLPEERTRAG